ncbi:unnamed protein product [Callosobruchus maculatus]|uniref:Uncharacterized protein n=1 Tax=Callosobruchus maculatus TaxID=64391 RepID=A0A653BIN9_CALMS|nr:unnamed protein product [Callosobruchus maculatus]
MIVISKHQNKNVKINVNGTELERVRSVLLLMRGRPIRHHVPGFRKADDLVVSIYCLQSYFKLQCLVTQALYVHMEDVQFIFCGFVNLIAFLLSLYSGLCLSRRKKFTMVPFGHISGDIIWSFTCEDCYVLENNLLVGKGSMLLIDVKIKAILMNYFNLSIDKRHMPFLETICGTVKYRALLLHG